nr:ABC transporter ATP-binding protein [Pseudomonas luteola]
MEKIEEIVRVEHVSRSYMVADAEQVVLADVSLSITRGQSCAMLGGSGSGKSTLLNIIGLLDKPSSGKLLLNGFDTVKASTTEQAFIRNYLIGFVFQSFNLLPRLSAIDNIALPLLYRGMSRTEARENALSMLQRVGLQNRSNYRPADLSGGQRQRIAIARALVGDPAIILADEPTGNLDVTNANEIMDLLLQFNSESSVTLIMVTHDNVLAQRLGRQFKVSNGRVSEIEK